MAKLDFSKAQNNNEKINTNSIRIICLIIMLLEILILISLNTPSL